MMRRPPYTKLLIVLLALLPAYAWALPSDREQPINIEADHAQFDDKQGITQYKGNAILTQGTLRIEGKIITFYYGADKQIIKIITQGKFATYQQVQKEGESPVHARALQMEYHARAQKIYLIGQGHVWQNGNEFSGSRIEYDITKNVVNANSTSSKIKGVTQKKERIHIIIQPPASKKKSAKKLIKKQTTPPAEKPKIMTESPDHSYPTAITSTDLNIRSGPGTKYKRLGVFSIGSEVIILTQQRIWLQVKGTVDGEAIIGWVNRRFIQLH